MITLVGSHLHIFHCIYIEFSVLLFLVSYIFSFRKNMLLVIFFIKKLKFGKFVTDISIAQEIQDSNNFSGFFQPRI